MTHAAHAPSVPRSREGSALLLTLLMVTLLLAMALTFSLLVRLDVRQSSERMREARARANARLGADLAVARLQDLLGPDQRVSAPADLYAAGGGNLARPSTTAHPLRRRLTAAYDVAAPTGSTPTFLGWLVSGSARDDFSLVAQAPASGDVRLVGPGSVELAGDQVLAAPVPLGASGRYAFWIGDEGVKARFNLQDPYRDSTDITLRQYSMKASQRHAAEMLSADGVRPLALDGLYPLDNPDFAARRDQLALEEQLPLLAPGNSAASAAYQTLRRNRFHDLTLFSRGLPVNVRDGGLKRDLSLAFEMPLADFNASEFGGGDPDSEVPVYRPDGYPAGERLAPVFRIDDFTPFGFQPENSPDGTAANPPHILAPVLRGPPWHLLRNCARLYKRTDADRSRYGLPAVSYTESGGERTYYGRSLYPAARGYTQLRRYGQDATVWTYAENYGPLDANHSVSEPVGRPIFPGVAPLVTRVQTVLSLRSRPADAALPGGARVLDLYIDPVVTLWNPYNVPLATGADNGQPLQLSVRYLNLTLRLQRSDTGQEIARELQNVFSDAAPGNAYDFNSSETFQLSFPSRLTFQPGEVMIFSATGRNVPYIRIPGMTDRDFSGVNLDLAPGITGYLPGDSGIRFIDPFKLQLPAATQVRLRTTIGNGNKFQVAGVNRTSIDSEPFIASFEAGTSSLNTSWSPYVPLTDPTLSAQKRPYLVFDAYLKHETSPNPVNLMTHFNLRAASYEQGNFFGVASAAYSRTLRQEDLWMGAATPLQSWNGAWLSNNGVNGYWGGSNTAAGGTTRVSLYEIPRLPPLSLGSLQHLQVSYMADEPSHVVGNSFAPVFGRDDAKLALQPLTPPSNDNLNDPRAPFNRSQWTMTRPDWSYLLNEALWDGYYFSGIVPDGSAPPADRFAAFQNGAPLPASIYSYRRGGDSTDADVLAGLFNAGLPRRDSPRLVSEHLFVEGAFNVNSTSVEAWRALLSSTRNLAINVQNNPAPRVVNGTAFSRTAIPYDREDDKWNGYRSLDDAAIDTLARHIVDEVRLRGPFAGLADFVNRRLAPAGHPVQKRGPLQAAIDRGNINANVNITLAGRGFNDATLNPWVRGRMDPESPVAMGAAGFLTQADLLTLLGPLLSARSDTFRVRAYGEHDGAEAWCEVLVQRVHDPLDDRDDTNRAFEIVGFRWLAPEDV